MSKRHTLLAGGLPLGLFIGLLAAEETLPSLTTLLVPFLIVLVLVLLNGFFVAAEFAIISVRRSQIEQMSDEGLSMARRVGKVLESPLKQDRYIATAQLGITLASLGLGMYGEPQVAHFIEPYLSHFLGFDPDAAIVHSVAFVLSLSLLTYLHIVIGEMVPKSMALSSSVRVVLAVIRPMQVAEAILKVPVTILNQIGIGILRLLRVPPAQGKERLHSPEELELIVAESTEGGLLNEDEQEIIRNIFDFSDRQVGQVMTPRHKIQAINVAMPFEELRRFVAQSKHSRFPVYEEDHDHVIGVLHIKDLVQSELESPENIDVKSLTRPLTAVPETFAVAALLASFKSQRHHMALVLDEFGGVAGIVTLEDLVEEIVGEVRDEFDFEREPLIRLSPGIIEVAGDFLVDDLEHEVYLGDEGTLPDVETVGGLIVTWLGRPPQVGDQINCTSDVLFTVLDVDGLAVSRAKVTFPTLADDNDEPDTATDDDSH